MISAIDFGIIFLYIISFIVIGIVITKKKVKSASDYTNAGQSLTLLVIIGSTLATNMGSAVIFGNYQLIHNSGIWGVFTFLGWYVGWFILAFTSRKMRSTGATSIPNYLERRFGPLARNIAAVAVLCMGIASTAAQFKSVGSVTASLGLCDANTGILVGALVILLFTVFSGLWGVAITDTIQSILILITVGLVVPVVAFKAAGGVNAAVTSITPIPFEDCGLGLGIFLSYWLADFFSGGAHPAYCQRSLAAKSDDIAWKGQVITCIISLVITLVASSPALFINKIFPDMVDGSQFVPTLIATYFPVGLKGLALACILGLLLTTGDTFLLLLSSTITDDIVRPRKPDINDKKLLNLGRLVCILGTVVIVGLALYIPTITELFKLGGSAVGCTTFFPITLGCFWKKLNTKAAVASMYVALPTSIIWDLFLKSATGMGGSLIAAPVSLAICVIGTLILNNKELSPKAA